MKKSEEIINAVHQKAAMYLRVCGALVILTVLTIIGTVHAAEGSGVLQLKEKFSVKKCGKGTNVSTVNFSFFSNNTWTASNSGNNYSGTYTEDKKGRKQNLTFNSTSENTLIFVLEDWATGLCGAVVTANSTKPITFKTKLNKKRTSMKTIVVYKATGSTVYGTGKAKYKAVGKGTYVEP